MEKGLGDRGGTTEYVVEAYLPERSREDLERIAARASRAARELVGNGKSVRYLRSIFLPEEETCFHVYAAGSAADVREACERAGIAAERVTAAIQAAVRPAARQAP